MSDSRALVIRYLERGDDAVLKEVREESLVVFKVLHRLFAVLDDIVNLLVDLFDEALDGLAGVVLAHDEASHAVLQRLLLFLEHNDVLHILK